MREPTLWSHFCLFFRARGKRRTIVAVSPSQVLTHAARAAASQPLALRGRARRARRALVRASRGDTRPARGFLNQYSCVRARLGSKFGRTPRLHTLCSVPPRRARREPQGYAGLSPCAHGPSRAASLPGYLRLCCCFVVGNVERSRAARQAASSMLPM